MKDSFGVERSEISKAKKTTHDRLTDAAVGGTVGAVSGGVVGHVLDSMRPRPRRLSRQVSGMPFSQARSIFGTKDAVTLKTKGAGLRAIKMAGRNRGALAGAAGGAALIGLTSALEEKKK